MCIRDRVKSERGSQGGYRLTKDPADYTAGEILRAIEGSEPDPSVETVMRGAEAMLKFEPDWIIAMGGGSPIDAAKAMWIKYEYATMRAISRATDGFSAMIVFMLITFL